MASRAVGYVRVSDESQVEGLSLDAQRREIERYCERHGHELEGFYADEGVSAHGEEIASRPQLVRLLDDAAAAAFDIVVVHTLDRWARNVGVQRQALKRLGDAGVGFASVTEQVDFTTPAGKLMLTMIGGVSEFFSDQLGVLVAKAKREQAERGLPPGPVPFGYIRTASRICLPDERDGQAVRRVFEVRAAGSSHGETAAWLNAQGFRTRTDRLFTPYATRDMSANVFYAGVVRYKGEQFPGQHERVVPPALFQRVQQRRAASHQRRRPLRRVGVLQGLVACAACGSTIHSELNRHGQGRYRERHGVSCRTNDRTVAAKFIDSDRSGCCGGGRAGRRLVA